MKRLLLLAAASVLLTLSCGGPVGGFQIETVLNGAKVSYPKARIYIDKVDIFARADGSIGYESLPPSATEYEYLLFTLAAGEKGKEPQFTMSWLSQAKEPKDIVGRNFPAFTMKMRPNLPGYEVIAPTTQYMASYNGETCYIVVVISRVDIENNWINGVFNGVYVEKVKDSWKRMEIKDGRFGAEFSWAKSKVAVGDTQTATTPEGKTK